MANPILSGISAYVDETKEELIAKSVLGAKTISKMNLMSGVKGATALHLLNTEVEFGDANACSFDANGEHVISQRVLTPAYLKINMEYCDKELLGFYTSHMVKIAAKQKTLPYEQEFMNGVSAGIQEKLEKLVWFGDSANANEFDGILKIAQADGANVINKAKGTSVYAAIKDAYLAVPEVAMKEDLTIFVSAGMFRNFVQELVALNLYHYDANDNALETVLPGTSVKVVAVNGLNGGDASADYIVVARTSNLVYGTDMQGDAEVFDFWYSNDDRVFKLAVEWTSGVQIAYPDEVVVVKIAK